MNRQQLQKLIQAGVFSATLLSGAAYAADMEAGTNAAPASTSDKPAKVKKSKHKATVDKEPAKHGCAGQNECKGKGGCKTADTACAGKNECKGKGGCGTDAPMPK